MESMSEGSPALMSVNPIFDKTSQMTAAKAGITVSTEAGKLVLTALRLPENDVTIETLILKDAG